MGWNWSHSRIRSAPEIEPVKYPPRPPSRTWEILTFRYWEGTNTNITFEAVSDDNEYIHRHLFDSRLTQEQVLDLLNRGAIK